MRAQTRPFRLTLVGVCMRAGHRQGHQRGVPVHQPPPKASSGWFSPLADLLGTMVHQPDIPSRRRLTMTDDCALPHTVALCAATLHSATQGVAVARCVRLRLPFTSDERIRLLPHFNAAVLTVVASTARAPCCGGGATHKKRRLMLLLDGGAASETTKPNPDYWHI
jgi:hypothetical protein